MLRVALWHPEPNFIESLGCASLPRPPPLLRPLFLSCREQQRQQQQQQQELQRQAQQQNKNGNNRNTNNANNKGNGKGVFDRVFNDWSNANGNSDNSDSSAGQGGQGVNNLAPVPVSRGPGGAAGAITPMDSNWQEDAQVGRAGTYAYRHTHLPTRVIHSAHIIHTVPYSMRCMRPCDA